MELHGVFASDCGSILLGCNCNCCSWFGPAPWSCPIPPPISFPHHTQTFKHSPTSSPVPPSHAPYLCSHLEARQLIVILQKCCQSYASAKMSTGERGVMVFVFGSVTGNWAFKGGRARRWWGSGVGGKRQEAGGKRATSSSRSSGSTTRPNPHSSGSQFVAKLHFKATSLAGCEALSLRPSIAVRRAFRKWPKSVSFTVCQLRFPNLL